MKATHTGTCQVCGAFQAVAAPRNVRLAKHGYTTKWGFFSGTCPGSGHKPLEVSCDLIQTYMDHAQAAVDAMTAEIATLTTDFSGTEAWAQKYTPAKFEGRIRIPAYYTWVKVTLSVEAKSYSTKQNTWTDLDGNVQTAEATTVVYDVVTYQIEKDGKLRTETVDIPYGEAKTLPNAIRVMNANRVFALRKDVAQRAMYVQWQRARLATWAPKALMPAAPEAPKKVTTRTVGARVEVHVGGGQFKAATVLQGSGSMGGMMMVPVKFDDGTAKSVRQAWLRLAAEAEA